MSKIKIIVCCHKDDIYKSSDVYLPIHVGKAISNTELGILGDDSGDNISNKNQSYCELTGMYWAWKNLKDVDIIGLCHYRRYFDFNHIGRRFFPITTIKSNDFNKINLDLPREVESLFKQGGVVIAKPYHLSTSVYQQYCERHYGSDFRIIGDIIRETLPPKYLQAFWNTQLKSNTFSPFNMFVMRWEQFDDYCHWLFPLLQMAEDRINITNYSSSQKRIFGYMAERLLNLYIAAEKIKTKHYPVIRFSDEKEIYDMSTIKYFTKTMLKDFATNLLSIVDNRHI